nr:hypothetical protein [Elizabethkingia bruuniana]
MEICVAKQKNFISTSMYKEYKQGYKRNGNITVFTIVQRGFGTEVPLY